MKRLTPDQIKDLLKKEKKQSVNRYKDEVDLAVDRVVGLYEQNKVDEVVFRTLVSVVLTATINDTVSGLRNDLATRDLLNIQSPEPNKLLLVNYSRKNYA